jgi:SAM-dependent methyltransferase
VTALTPSERLGGGDPRGELQQCLDRVFEELVCRRALDAGCGARLAVRLPEGVHLVGIDVSREALARNERLDEAIVGDLQEYPLPREEFDAVVCWWVLEHLPRPERAVANMAGSLRPGGVLVVAVPRLWSLKGLVTRLTPHRFHVWAYRRLLGLEHAGHPGVGPYRTYLRRDIDPERLRRLAREHGLERIFARTFGDAPPLPRALGALWSLSITTARLVTLGRWDAQGSEHLAVFRKVAGEGADAL